MKVGDLVNWIHDNDRGIGIVTEVNTDDRTHDTYGRPRPEHRIGLPVACGIAWTGGFMGGHTYEYISNLEVINASR